MKRILILAGIIVCLLCLQIIHSHAQTKSSKAMKLNAGITTNRIQESKEFYTKALNFGITFENEFYLLLHTPDERSQLSFLLPNHDSQQPIFKPAYLGQGMYLTIEVEDVDLEYMRLLQMGVSISFPVRTEPWGDRHFGLMDPNGIAIDIVTYTPPDNK